MPTADALTISADLRPGERDAVVDGLVAYNVAHGFAWPRRDCDLVLRDAAGAGRGGALGETNAGWLFLKALWVDAALRGRGHGRRLLAAAEAAAAGLPERTFRAQFRARFGVPPHRYVLAVRVEAARGLLRATRRPISDIALSLGFAHQAHLARVFAQHVGTSPGRFRLGLRG